MTKIDNLNSGQLAPLMRRIESLERALPLASASVERGRMRFYEGSELLIQDSNLNVVGTATIRGTLRADGTIAFTGTLTQSGPSTFTGQTNVSGDFNVTGPTKLNGKTDIGGNTSVTGDLTVTGPTKLNGKTDIGGNTKVTGTMDVEGPMGVTGTLDIKGKSTLQNDLEVRNGGKVKVGSMTLDPDVGSGAMKFANGGQVYSDGGSVQVFKGTSVVQVEDGKASLMGDGGNYVTADSTGVRVSGGLRVMSPPTAPADAKANVYMDASGNIRRLA